MNAPPTDTGLGSLDPAPSGTPLPARMHAWHETHALSADLVIHRPEAAGVTAREAELLLLFHGVGADPESMRPLGEALARHRPGAWVVCVRSPHPSDMGPGWQWFSVRGITDAHRPERVAMALPAFAERVNAWQQRAGVGPEHTVLIGFSQGAIMALESTQCAGRPRLASRVLAVAGRFATPPRRLPDGVTLHLLHGDDDRVMPVGLAVEADLALQRLGADTTLDRFPGLGHGIDARVVDTLLRRLVEPARPTPALPAVALHLDDERLVVRSRPHGPDPAEPRLALGTARIARDFFHHDPPTAHELERAIDFVEDQLMRLGPPHDAGRPLWSASPALQPWAHVSGPTMSLDRVEQWFGQLALAAQGRTTAVDGLPQGRDTAAALLVLRELMHHRGHPSITVVDEDPAPRDNTGAV